LLNFAVSDVSDDVKRAALTNLGFLLFRSPSKVPETVKHLADSYNPHLRYGAAMAVGIGCAGSGLTEALKLLAPLTNDQTDFVRQGALIALSMVFIQVTEAQEPKVATIRKLFTKMF
jgi:26S proteasome regulatory subunit N2